jgi:uncharacterized glyoxalase superfamily protein PhnB
MTNSKGNIIPLIFYKDAGAAIDWLCEAFGFERRVVLPGEGGAIIHAQLTLGNGMIMLRSAGDDDVSGLMSTPSGGRVTQVPYIFVEDIDAHYRQVKAAGADIAVEIADQPHGHRLYFARDPEGHIWNFGSYDPW